MKQKRKENMFLYVLSVMKIKWNSIHEFKNDPDQHVD